MDNKMNNEYDENLLWKEAMEYGLAEQKRHSEELRLWHENRKNEYEQKRKAAFIPPIPDGGWQPMDTAPKDGTMVDIWVVHGSVGYRLIDIRWYEKFHGEWDWYDSEEEKAFYSEYIEAVAWMKWKK